MLSLNQIRQRYLHFFTARQHQLIDPAPLIPHDDATTLFTSSGMQQLVPFLKGQPHPAGRRLVDSQPCFRAEDIEEIGDNRHTTFFEMLGNWSLGDYFKKEQLTWIWQFFTQELNLPPDRLHVTVFAGNEDIPKDEEAYQIWRSLGVPESHIHWYGVNKNWWSRSGPPQNMPPGEIGGPDSEIFYDFGDSRIHDSSPFKNQSCHVNCDCGRYLEIGNSVFMQYQKQADGSFKLLPQKNVDFGGGLERLTAVLQNKQDVFQIDAFLPLIQILEHHSSLSYSQPQPRRSMRIIADHLRAATFMVGQGLYPSNKMQGYVLRRLLRRATFQAQQLHITSPVNVFTTLIDQIFHFYSDYFSFPNLDQASSIITEEVAKFQRALHRGLKVIEKHSSLDAQLAFDLLQTYGFPFELTLEIAQQRGQHIDVDAFQAELAKHKQLSRTTSRGLFKGGLTDHSQNTVKLHTATHLLHQALRIILGSHVRQIGSHITPQRLRFDFTHPRSLTKDEIQRLEDLVNQKIAENLPVHHTIEDKDQALASGALAFFHDKYAQKVSVYTIGKDPQHDWFSKEFCGGPHVSSTGEIKGIKITKETSIGAGKRRLYAILKSS